LEIVAPMAHNPQSSATQFRLLEATNIYKSLRMNHAVANPMDRQGPQASTDLSKAADILITLLREQMSRLFAERDRVPIAFSGGVDSTLLVTIAREYGEVEAITAGLEGCVDFENAERASAELDIELKKIVLSEKEVIEAASRMTEITDTANRLFISFELPSFIVLESLDGYLLTTGQGADELFGGYAKYLDKPISEFEHIRKLDIEKLVNETVPLENRIAEHFGKTIERPYISEEIHPFARNLPIEILYPTDGIRKRVIREAILSLGLSELLANTEKKAAQYGSGVNRILKKANKEEISVHDSRPQ